MKKNSAQKQITKKNLRTLTKNGRTKKVRSVRRVVKYGAINFGRNIWLSTAATLVMTITLIVLSITLVATVVLNETATAMRDKIDITLFFKPGTGKETLEVLKEVMSNDPNVKSIETRTSEEEYANFLEENKDNELLIETLEDPTMDMRSTMISTMQSTMRLKVYDTENLDSIKNIVASDINFVKNLDETEEPTYDVNKTEIATITRWSNIATTGGIALSAVFIVVSVLVIFNTIRMAIFSRREEIYMMKLVGADRYFIRGPFLVEAQLSGLVSGILASGLSYFGFRFLEPRLAQYGINVTTVTNILNSNKIVLVILAMILAGGFIGTLSARLAIQKYLRSTAK
ncbi:permease-like cell division protein FtsX [Candidatus Saccharibacteria bacterium]|nr:permease-like cell division protein FtsX [Candidatus Saccharibacteria bacterium]MBR6123120.1 permease-like cell division protein FtsX [Candidatus Saccharibacteria bacterium]